MNCNQISLAVIVLQITVSCVFSCGENGEPVSVPTCNVRRRRDSLSENVIIGMDYFGKPKIVCHCDKDGVWKLKSNNILATRRAYVIKANAQAKPGNDLIYTPECCKSDLSNPNKLYRYPFTLHLPDQPYNDNLANENSQEYQKLNQLKDGISQLLSNQTCVISTDISKFRDYNRTVLADIVLTVRGSISENIIEILKCAVLSGKIAGVVVNVIPESLSTTPSPNAETTPNVSTEASTTLAPTIKSESVEISTSVPLLSNKTKQIMSPTSSEGNKIRTSAASVRTEELQCNTTSTVVYDPYRPGKDFKVTIVLTEKSFDLRLNDTSSPHYQELKRIMEQSLIEMFRCNSCVLSATLVSVRPTVPNSNNSLNGTGNGNPFPGLEVTFEVKFWEERPGQLEPLKTKLQTETLGSHKVWQNMTAVIITQECSKCPSDCSYPIICYPQCSTTCCSPSQVPPCLSPCSST